MDRRVSPPKRVTSPTWGLPPPCKKALSLGGTLYVCLLLFYRKFVALLPLFFWVILSFLCLDTMESFSLDSAIDPGLHEAMDELLESVYGEEILSQQSQLSVVALVSDEDDNCDSDNETFSCDPDTKRLAGEFVESNNWERENDDDNYAEGEEEEEEIPKRCGCSKQCFSLFENKRQLITDYRRNLAEFTKDEKETLLLTKLEQMEHSGEETRQGKRTCQRFKYYFQGHQICDTSLPLKATNFNKNKNQ